MFIEYFITILTVLFIVCIVGYVAATMKEKVYLSKDMIVINNRNISQKDIDNVDTRCFSIGSIKIMSGDEIKIVQSNLEVVKGMVIGANIQKKTIVVAENSKPVEICTKGIKKIKIISRYGKFLRNF